MPSMSCPFGWLFSDLQNDLTPGMVIQLLCRLPNEADVPGRPPRDAGIGGAGFLRCKNQLSQDRLRTPRVFFLGIMEDGRTFRPTMVQASRPLVSGNSSTKRDESDAPGMFFIDRWKLDPQQPLPAGIGTQ